MTQEWDWRPAHASDQHEIDHFVCTEPAKPKRSRQTNWQDEHPRLWEYDAQQMIRGLRVPSRGSVETWVMTDEHGIAGVCSWTRLNEPGYVHLDVAGVAMRHREARTDLGFTMMSKALGEIEQWAVDVGALEMVVECEIFHANGCSLRLMRRFRMDKSDEAPTGAQTWGLKFPLARLSD